MIMLKKTITPLSHSHTNFRNKIRGRNAVLYNVNSVTNSLKRQLSHLNVNYTISTATVYSSWRI